MLSAANYTARERHLPALSKKLLNFMDHPSKRLRQKQNEELAATQHQRQGATARQFTTPEEVLRFDAAQTQVPPVIIERLQASISREPPVSSPWWKRWLGRANLL